MSRRHSPESDGPRFKNRHGRNVPQRKENQIGVEQPKETSQSTSLDPETFAEWLRNQDRKKLTHRGRRIF